MVACYLALIEIGKRWFYRTAPAGPAIRHRNPGYRLPGDQAPQPRLSPAPPIST